MELIKGLLKYPNPVPLNQCYLCTSNTTVKRNGELVMGAGNAKAFRGTYQSSASYFGKLVTDPINMAIQDEGAIGTFRTKRNWREASNTALVQESVTALHHWATKYPNWTFHLPFPAIGYGGLSLDEVKPMLDSLPNNVKVYL